MDYVAEVTMDTSGVMPHRMVGHDGHVVDDFGYCEVPHMVKADAQGALCRGATAVTVYPYTGWDCIWPFLEAGLKVYVYPVNRYWPLPGWPRLWRSWQQRTRRKYGSGRLLLWRSSRKSGRRP